MHTHNIHALYKGMCTCAHACTCISQRTISESQFTAPIMLVPGIKLILSF